MLRDIRSPTPNLKLRWQRTAPYNSVQRVHNTRKHPNRDGHFTPEAS